jgi:hypothetical protein
MVQGTNFPPIPQGKGVKKNHAFLEQIDNKKVKLLTLFVISNRYSNQTAKGGNDPYKKYQ